MLAGIPDTVRIRSLLCKQPSDSQGIPVSCEVDIYGTLSEFIGQVVSNDIVTLLDINNSVPKDMYKESIEGKFDYTLKDTLWDSIVEILLPANFPSAR